MTSRPLTRRFPRRTTARRTTPGVVGAGIPASSPLSLPEEMVRSFATMLKLSRLDPAFLITASRAKYPPLDPSNGFPAGGDPGPGLAIELWPLALLELFLLRTFFNLFLCICRKFGPLGEKPPDQTPPGLDTFGGPPKGCPGFLSSLST